jgi:hypothetical protein
MMQPYLFPYLGYFQLIAAVDVFVLGDDLQYVKRTWINRNRILMNGQARMISFPLRKDSHTLDINQRVLCPNFTDEIETLLRVIAIAYAKAPCFKMVFAFLEEVLRFPDFNLGKYAIHSVRRLCDYIGIGTPIVVSSDLSIDKDIDKQDRVILTTRKLGADVYINLIGGVDLYSEEYLKEHGIDLKFHRINDIRYRQFDNEFVPLLSIIDVLMFNEIADVKKMLADYSLVDHHGNPA